MNDALSKFVLLEAYFPNICLFLVSALKSSAVVLLGWGAVSFLKSRSGPGEVLGLEIRVVRGACVDRVRSTSVPRLFAECA